MKKWICILLALLVFASTSAFAESTAVNTVTAGDMKMDYIAFGSGERAFVILPGLSIHSVMGSAAALETAFAEFTEDYTVYVFDRAKNLTEGYTVRDMANDTALAMQELGIQDADIFGASQGGMMALYLAIDHPELVHKMVLASTLSKPNATSDEVIGNWIALAQARDENGLLESFADKVYSEATLEAYRDVLISSNAGITEEEYERFIILASACATYDCTDSLSEIQCPVLVIGAEGDQVTTAQAGHELAKALNCESFFYGTEYGHGVYDEAPDFRQRMLDFLQA